MNLLQSEIAQEAIRQTFEISPGTVFGVLVGLLLFFILAMGYAFWRSGKWLSGFVSKIWDEWQEQHKADIESEREERNKDRVERQAERSAREAAISEVLATVGKLTILVEQLEKRIDRG